VPEPDASLAAEAGIAVLRVAFLQWVTEPDGPGLPETMRAVLDRLRTISGG
jgi:hypothetical protein